MKFVWDISLGTLIAFASLAIGLWRAHTSNQRRFGALEEQVRMLVYFYQTWIQAQMKRQL